MPRPRDLFPDFTTTEGLPAETHARVLLQDLKKNLRVALDNRRGLPRNSLGQLHLSFDSLVEKLFANPQSATADLASSSGSETQDLANTIHSVKNTIDALITAVRSSSLQSPANASLAPWPEVEVKTEEDSLSDNVGESPTPSRQQLPHSTRHPSIIEHDSNLFGASTSALVGAHASMDASHFASTTADAASSNLPSPTRRRTVPGSTNIALRQILRRERGVNHALLIVRKAEHEDRRRPTSSSKEELEKSKQELNRRRRLLDATRSRILTSMGTV